MNALRPLPTPSNPLPSKPSSVGAAPSRHLHRERDFGVGYGNSSGYASARRYTQNWGQPRFRCH